MSGFSDRIKAYGSWRAELADAVGRYGQWLADGNLSDPQLQARLGRVLDRLRDDRMSIAFVAEFSRGKSELINALFFADYGQRVLPSAAGRTTMCPTELLWDASQPPGIRLLPIETRLRDATVSELRHASHEWRFVPFDPDDVESLKLAFEAVREVKRVPVEEAILMGLYDETDDDSPVVPDEHDMVEISCWRHALVNVPHPLLRTGLVVVDTPGLNAIGAEPELTLNLIPTAHAVLFVLAADAGVTRSDVEVWRERISPAHRSGRFVVLNKIDGLWDGLKRPEEIDREIESQVRSVAATLQLPQRRVFPVSAQKGLVGRITGDDALLARSRLPELEHALSTEVVPHQQSIVREQVGREFDEAYSVTHGVLSARRRNLVEQVVELEGLRGKNRGAVEQMARRIRVERAEFEASLKKLQALRTVFGRHQQGIYKTVGVEQLKRHVRDARNRMRSSRLSLGLRDGMASLIEAVRGDFDRLGRAVDEVQTLMTAMYGSFNREHGLTLGTPLAFSTRGFVAELERIEALHQRHFGTMSLVTTEKWALTRRFFESVAARIRDVYERAGRDLEAWLRAVIAPIESQVREHQAQLRRRLDAVQRVIDASGQLEERIAELREQRTQVERQLESLQALCREVHAALEREDSSSDAALPA
ncbi:MAG TPA: dynamin family protein [Burkholderiaceae bacterium]|nr:dynamin family protein [Burkholderiaceae bacterium]